MTRQSPPFSLFLRHLHVFLLPQAMNLSKAHVPTRIIKHRMNAFTAKPRTDVCHLTHRRDQCLVRFGTLRLVPLRPTRLIQSLASSTL